jgi:hypothetical protein
MSKSETAQQGGTPRPQPQQQGQTGTQSPQQQGGTPVFRDWASI